MKNRSFILVAIALLLALTMAITGCAAATDSSGPTTEAVNNETIILDKNAVFTIEGVIQAFAEGYNPVYFVGERDLTKTDVDFLNARSFVPAGKTLVVTTYASRSGTSVGKLNMNAVGETLKVVGNLTVKSDIAGLRPSFALATGAKLAVGGNFEVGKLGVADVAGTVTQTSGSKINIAGGSFTLKAGAAWTVQRASETEASPGIDITIGKDSVVELLAPIVIGSGDFTVAAKSGGVINDAPTVYIAAVITGDENSTATLGAAPVFGSGGALKIANKVSADGTVSDTTKTGATNPTPTDWTTIDTYVYVAGTTVTSTTFDVPSGKTMEFGANVDAGKTAIGLSGDGTYIIPEGVTVSGTKIEIGTQVDDDPATTPTLVINGKFVGTITSAVTGKTGAAAEYPHIVMPKQGLELAIGDDEEIEVDKDGYLILSDKFSVTRELLVPSTARYDLDAVSGSKVGAKSRIIIQPGAKIKPCSRWFDCTNNMTDLDAEMETGALKTYIVTFNVELGDNQYAEPDGVTVRDTANNVYLS
jgi:hypothetical protein